MYKHTKILPKNLVLLAFCMKSKYRCRSKGLNIYVFTKNSPSENHLLAIEKASAMLSRKPVQCKRARKLFQCQMETNKIPDVDFMKRTTRVDFMGRDFCYQFILGYRV